MSHALEPRKVEPGALLRWTKQAAQLNLISPLSWLVSGAVFIGLSMLSYRSWYGLSLIGLWCHVHFQLMANRADRGKLSVFTLHTSFGASLYELLVFIRSSPFLLLMNMLVLSIVPLLYGINMLYLPGPPEKAAALTGVLQQCALGPALMFGAFIQGHRAGFRPLGYLVSKFCGHNARVRALLTNKERFRNGYLGFAFDVTTIGIALAAETFVPALAIVPGFLGAWAYVAFRDIYLHQDGNRVHAKASEPSVQASPSFGT